MKMKKFGVCVWSSQTYKFSLYDIQVAWSKEQACKNYIENREQGLDSDNPNWQFPKDGQFIWIKGEVKDKDIYGIQGNDGYYYEIRYVAGSGDEKWMQEKCDNYLRRLDEEVELNKPSPIALAN